jgi:hypothetical protein
VFFALAHETFDLADAGKIVVQKGIHGRGSATLQAITPMRRKRVPQRTAG